MLSLGYLTTSESLSFSLLYPSNFSIPFLFSQGKELSWRIYQEAILVILIQPLKSTFISLSVQERHFLYRHTPHCLNYQPTHDHLLMRILFALIDQRLFSIYISNYVDNVWTNLSGAISFFSPSRIKYSRNIKGK